MTTKGVLYYCDTCKTGYSKKVEADGCEKMCGLFTMLTHMVRNTLYVERDVLITLLQELTTAYQTSNNLTPVPVTIKAAFRSDGIAIYWPGKEIPENEKIYWRLLHKMFNDATGQAGSIHTELNLYEASTILKSFNQLFATINSAGHRQHSDAPETSDRPSSDASTP